MSNFFCDYEILGELGRGGMSIVYRAQNRNGEKVALKKLLPALTSDPSLVERFRRAPEMYPRHPFIIPILDAGVCNDTPYYVMELVEGFTLEKFIKEAGFITPERFEPVLRSVAQGLDAIHAMGLIHRDIKPSNVLIRKSDWHIFLTDLDIARNTLVTKLTATGALVGTADYMSPEQAYGGKDLTLSSDVYSLGILTYQALSGYVPFKADSAMAVMRMHMQDAPPLLEKVNPKINRRVSKVVMKALEKKPEKRYASAGAFANAFARAIAQPQTGLARPAWISVAALGGLILAGAAVMGLAANQNGANAQNTPTPRITTIQNTPTPTSIQPAPTAEKTVTLIPVAPATVTQTKPVMLPTATLAPELPTLTPIPTKPPPTRTVRPPTITPSVVAAQPTAAPQPPGSGGGNPPQPTATPQPQPTSPPAPTNPPPTNAPPTPSP